MYVSQCKQNTVITLITIFVFLVLISVRSSFAQEQREYVIGVEDINYYPLFNFSTQEKVQSSFAFDVLTAFFESKKYNYRFVALPIKRFDKWFVDHNIDFKFPDNIRWRADGGKSLNLTFSDPVLTLVAGTYVLKNNNKITREQVKSLMTIRDFYPTLWLDLIAENKVVLHEEGAPISIVRHLLLGNVQATNIDESVIRHQLKKLNKSGEIELAENIYHEQYSYHMSSNNHPEIIREFNQFIKQERHLIESIKQKYEIKE